MLLPQNYVLTFVLSINPIAGVMFSQVLGLEYGYEEKNEKLQA